jgi:1-acyl-sn-glycerol-3-phosphate acyltransferase
MELLAVLKQEFDTVVPEEEAPGMLNVGQVLERLPDAEDAEDREEFSWARIVRTVPEPPFENRYSMRRPVFRVLIHPIRLFARTLFRTIVRFEMTGDESLPTDRRFILAPTHQSLLDAQLIYVNLKVPLLSRISFFALEEYFRYPGASILMKFFRIIPSGTEQTMLSSMQYAFRSLELEGGLCIFPEGHRSPDGRIGKGKIGLGVLACESGAPVYPARFDGGMAVLSRLNKGIHRSTIRLVIGPPIHPPKKESYSEADYRELSREWKDAVEKIEV